LLCAVEEWLTRLALSVATPACCAICGALVESEAAPAPAALEPVPARSRAAEAPSEVRTWSSTHHALCPPRSSAIRCSEASMPPVPLV